MIRQPGMVYLLSLSMIAGIACWLITPLYKENATLVKHIQHAKIKQPVKQAFMNIDNITLIRLVHQYHLTLTSIKEHPDNRRFDLTLSGPFLNVVALFSHLPNCEVLSLVMTKATQQTAVSFFPWGKTETYPTNFSDPFVNASPIPEQDNTSYLIINNKRYNLASASS